MAEEEDASEEEELEAIPKEKEEKKVAKPEVVDLVKKEPEEGFQNIFFFLSLSIFVWKLKDQLFFLILMH